MYSRAHEVEKLLGVARLEDAQLGAIAQIVGKHSDLSGPRSRRAAPFWTSSKRTGDADLLRQELVAAPGGAGTPVRLVVSNQTGSLQGTVNLNGSPAACWVYLIANGGNAQPVVSLRSNGSGNYSAPHLPPGSYQAVAFERRHSANYRDAASLAAFASHVRSVTVNAGEKPTLNLDAVPVAEVAP